MHTFTNTKKAIQISSSFWDVTTAAGLANIVTRNSGNGRHEAIDTGHRFINMSSYSYLGLDSHPDILQAAADAVLKTGSLNTSISRIRVQFDILQRAEQALEQMVDAQVLTTASCAAAAGATLPLLASGALTEDIAPLMVFDKNAHFCLNMMKPICADETEVATIRHNDLNALEDLCKAHPRVAYVADGVYSTGGMAPVKELLQLQEKYGLFLYFDEAHGFSTIGRNGRGVVLEEMGAINDRTMIIISLNKGFGGSGGAILLGPRGDQQRRNLATRFGGPITWSQRINTAGLGAIMKSAEIHLSDALPALQGKLQANIRHFDELIDSENRGDGLPIRFVSIGSETNTITYAKALLEAGFYTSPIFFPVIAKGRAGLRIMIRANMSMDDIARFAGVLNQLKASA